MANSPFLGIPDVRGATTRELAELAQRAGLPAELIAGALRGPASVPTTNARLTHAYRLRTSGGRTIGAVYQCDEDQGRNVDLEFEVDVNGVGQPADIIPQDMTTQTLTIARWDLYTSVIEEAFTNFELSMLTDQSRGFRLQEVWRAPTSILNSTGRLYEYRPCFFARIGRKKSATDERTTRTDAVIVWLDRSRIA